VAAIRAAAAATGKPYLSVAVIGPPGGGKTSLVNALVGEPIGQVSPLQSRPERPLMAARAVPALAPGDTPVTLTIMDTPAAMVGDAEWGPSLAATAAALAGAPGGVDALLWVDRADLARVDAADVQLAGAYARALGPEIWDKTVIVLTRARLDAPPPGVTPEAALAARGEAVRGALRKAGAGRGATLPVLLADTSSRCPTNEAGEPLLRDGAPWVPSLFEGLAAFAAAAPAPALRLCGGDRQAAVNAALGMGQDVAGRRSRRLVPLALALQAAAFLLAWPRLMEADGRTGTRWGPFDRSGVDDGDSPFIKKQKQQGGAVASKKKKRAAGGRG